MPASLFGQIKAKHILDDPKVGELPKSPKSANLVDLRGLRGFWNNTKGSGCPGGTLSGGSGDGMGKKLRKSHGVNLRTKSSKKRKSKTRTENTLMTHKCFYVNKILVAINRINISFSSKLLELLRLS